MAAGVRQIVPNSAPIWAVFADEKGEPLFVTVACVGTVADEEGKTFVVGFCVGPHLEPPDARPNFIGYADAIDPGPWKARCENRRREMNNTKLLVAGKPEFGK